MIKTPIGSGVISLASGHAGAYFDEELRRARQCVVGRFVVHEGELRQ